MQDDLIWIPCSPDKLPELEKAIKDFNEYEQGDLFYGYKDKAWIACIFNATENTLKHKAFENLHLKEYCKIADKTSNTEPAFQQLKNYMLKDLEVNPNTDFSNSQAIYYTSTSLPCGNIGYTIQRQSEYFAQLELYLPTVDKPVLIGFSYVPEGNEEILKDNLACKFAAYLLAAKGNDQINKEKREKELKRALFMRFENWLSSNKDIFISYQEKRDDPYKEFVFYSHISSITPDMDCYYVCKDVDFPVEELKITIPEGALLTPTRCSLTDEKTGFYMIDPMGEKHEYYELGHHEETPYSLMYLKYKPTATTAIVAGHMSKLFEPMLAIAKILDKNNIDDVNVAILCRNVEGVEFNGFDKHHNYNHIIKYLYNAGETNLSRTIALKGCLTTVIKNIALLKDEIKKIKALLSSSTDEETKKALQEIESGVFTYDEYLYFSHKLPKEVKKIIEERLILTITRPDLNS